MNFQDTLNMSCDEVRARLGFGPNAKTVFYEGGSDPLDVAEWIQGSLSGEVRVFKADAYLNTKQKPEFTEQVLRAIAGVPMFGDVD